MATRARCHALAAHNPVELKRPGLHGLLFLGLPLLCQLGLDLYDGIVLVMAAPSLVCDGAKRKQCLVWHRDGLDGASAPFLDVDLLGFPPEESSCVHLKLVPATGGGTNLHGWC